MHKMLKNIHSLFKVKEGPELLPKKARFWILSFALAMGLSIYLFRNSTYYQTTVLGVLLSMFGAGVLYWETVISDEEANGVYHEITREGSSRNLSESEQKSVLWFFLAGGLELILLIVLFTYEARHGKSFTLIKKIQILISLLVPSFGPMTALYAMLKFIKSSNNKNLTRMKNQTKEERVVLVRTYLRRFGFKTLFAAGILQYIGIAIDYYK